jgi:hypothetical protein
MTVIDWIIVAALGWFIFWGFRKGFVRQLFTLIGSILALVLGFYFYEKVGVWLAAQTGLSIPLANVVGFILLSVIIGGTAGFIGSRWRHKHKDEPVALIDSSFGALFGGVKAGLILLIILLVLVSLPWDFVRGPIESSNLSVDILRFAPFFYLVQDKSLPPNVPRLVVSPEGLQMRSPEDATWKNAICFACGGKVTYKGFIQKGLAAYPQVICTKCGRTSDGCLTFQGFHMLNNVCPYQRLGSLNNYDCKVWPNPKPATVHGKCPVCGRSL